jgi:PAS domain S-box-containing protein
MKPINPLETAVPVKNSLATKLLKAVFSIYILIAIALTSIQMLTDYYRAKKDIVKEIKAMHTTYKSSLAQVIWDGDIDQLKVMVEGINESPIIIGVKINTDMLENLHSGIVPVPISDPDSSNRKTGTISNIFELAFPIVFSNPSEKETVGEISFYSSTDIVFKKVKINFLIIIINSVIKTIILWILFIWIFKRLLGRPLNQLTMAITKLKPDNLEKSVIQIQSSDRNELKILEESFNSMLENLHFHIRKTRLTEEYLKASEEKYRGIFENAIEGIFQIDENWKLTSANPSLAHVMGYETPEQLMSETPFLGENMCLDHNRRMELLSELSKKGRIVNFEIQLRKHDHSLIWVSLNVWTIKGDRNKIPRIEGTLMDVTERRKTKEIMIHNEKIISLGGLAAGMAHEINNPLAGMIQNAQVLYNRLNKSLPTNEKIAIEVGTTMAAINAYMEKRGIIRQLESINTEGMRAAQIVRNMLNFVRKSNSVKQKHYLDDVIKKTLVLAENDYDLKKRYDFRQINVLQEYEPDLPGVFCEESTIQQVIFNILKNAAEALSERHQAQNNPMLTIRLLKDDNMVRIDIEDNGPGIDEITRKRIFEPFFTTKNVDKGTGLGLSVSYYIIVENHNGEMFVESIEGQGTTFTIKLPAITDDD